MSTPDPSPKKRRVLAIASGGGHFEQMMLLGDAFADAEVTYVTTITALLAQVPGGTGEIVADCNRARPFAILTCARQLWRLLRRYRPDVVVTTGALPGLIALILAKALRARTIWIDSIANAERLSASGRLARRIADLCLSQWPEVARSEGVSFAGAVL